MTIVEISIVCHKASVHDKNAICTHVPREDRPSSVAHRSLRRNPALAEENLIVIEKAQVQIKRAGVVASI